MKIALRMMTTMMLLRGRHRRSRRADCYHTEVRAEGLKTMRMMVGEPCPVRRMEASKRRALRLLMPRVMSK